MNYLSRTIQIGGLMLGGTQPIRLQSMTSTSTMDTHATVAQSIRMIEAGCEMVRITAPGIKEATHLQVIKDELKRKGYQVPLIADIHFNPGAAEVAARIVEKVRINPGNYTDRNTNTVNYTDVAYAEELERIAERLYPLLKICREYGTAIRIGTNHGSLSQRIVNRYGDTPEGMVQSALEFTRICSAQGFHNLVLSMKSSNVRVMVSAYRMLAGKLQAEGLNYPLHLGVTEAGDGEDGRLKSISGIGALLARGIGDTIRVSLTEEPEFELPVARAIAGHFQQHDANGQWQRSIRPDLAITQELQLEEQPSETSGLLGGKNLPAVVVKKEGKYLLAEESGRLDVLPHQLVNLKQTSDTEGQMTLLEVNDALINNNMAVLLQRMGDNRQMVVIAAAAAGSVRQLVSSMQEIGLKNPLLLMNPHSTAADYLTGLSLNPGSSLLDGLGDGICVDAGIIPEEDAVRIGFGLLQATRMRVTRTEFIACPSCGRTLFNIQEALQQVKARTAHLKGLKIGVMGCIVNGPGEMADADYGYVGAGNGRVTLYKGKEPVRRSIPESEAVEALVQLMKDGGDWHEVSN